MLFTIGQFVSFFALLASLISGVIASWNNGYVLETYWLNATIVSIVLLVFFFFIYREEKRFNSLLQKNLVSETLLASFLPSIMSMMFVSFAWLTSVLGKLGGNDITNDIAFVTAHLAIVFGIMTAARALILFIGSLLNIRTEDVNVEENWRDSFYRHTKPR